MKMINVLVILLSITQIISAKPSEFKLDVGNEQTILLGEGINLNGRVISGDKSKIDHYQWSAYNEILKNTSEDEIIYWDEENAENEYIPSVIGTNILKFEVIDTSGKKYTKRLVVNVKSGHISYQDIKFDIDSKFPLICQAPCEKKFNYYVNVEVGDIIPLSGIVEASKKDFVDNYRWEHNGTILKNQLGDDILYWDENNRENDYVVTKSGDQLLDFIVTDRNNKESNRSLLLKVIDTTPDDYGNTKDDATEIELNKIIHGEKNYKNDHDFFSFTLKKKLYVMVHIKYANASKKATLYTSDLEVIPSAERGISGFNYLPKSIFLDAGTYYVDASLYTGKYTLKIETEDVGDDEYGDTKETATEVFPNHTVHSYINTDEDIDYFYFMPKADGFISIKKNGNPKFKVDESKLSYYYKQKVIKGHRIYFHVKKSTSNYRVRHYYDFSFTFTKK